MIIITLLISEAENVHGRKRMLWSGSGREKPGFARRVFCRAGRNNIFLHGQIQLFLGEPGTGALPYVCRRMRCDPGWSVKERVQEVF